MSDVSKLCPKCDLQSKCPEKVITWEKCPRCGKTDILVIINGLKPMCRVCLKTAIDILEGRDF